MADPCEPAADERRGGTVEGHARLLRQGEQGPQRPGGQRQQGGELAGHRQHRPGDGARGDGRRGATTAGVGAPAAAPRHGRAPSGTVAGTQPPSPFGYDEFLDGTDPATWTTLERLQDVVAYHVGGPAPVFDEPQSFAREDAFVARFVDVDGRFTLDLTSVNEDTLGALGTRDAVLARYLEGVGDRVDEPILEDCVSGSSGPGHACCVDLAGDAALRVDLYGPAEVPVDQLRAIVCRVLRDALREP
ncbi:MAG: hypothetical protein R2726_04055 [Acidimicrobiales bacterium]